MSDEASSRAGICCAGNWIIDHVKTISFFPQEETLTNIIAEELGTGGSAYNVLVDLARFKVPIVLSGLGLVGDDADGQRILTHLDELGIDRRLVRAQPGVSTSYTDVMTVRTTGKRTFFHCRGANAVLGPEHFPVKDIKARIVSLGYLLLLDTLDSTDPVFGTKAARVLESLRAAGIRTVIDVVSEDSDRFSSIVTPALPYADDCIINEIEAGRTTGHSLRRGGKLDRAMVEVAAEVLLEKGVKRLVVIHAPEASFGLTADGERRWQPGHRLPDGFIAGTAGAGDAFYAGMLLGIHESWPLEKSLKFATSSAATCLRHPTTTGGVGSSDEIWEIARNMPYRSLD